MAKIIEARALITAQDTTGAAFASVAKKIEAMSKAQGQMSKAGSAEVQKMARQIEAMQSKLGQIEGFRSLSRGLDQASVAMRKAQQEAARMKSALDSATAPSRQMARDYERASKAADQARGAFIRQGQAVREIRGALDAAGVPINNLANAQRDLEKRINGATEALKRQKALEVSKPATAAPVVEPGKGRKAIGQAAGAVPGAVVVDKAKDVGKKAIENAAEFDYATRRQQAYADLSKEEQERILIPQAQRIGADTKFTNTDVVEAQTTIASRLPAHLKKADVIAPLVQNSKNYALSMKGTTMDDAAQAVSGYLLSTGQDISTPEKATAGSQRASNLLIRSAKLGAMNHEDLMQMIQRGLPAAAMAGLSPETALSFGIGLNRSNIRGDQAATALRTVSAKLVAPTRGGIAALAAGGIDYNKFTKMPGGLSVENLEGKFKQDFGKDFTPEVREKLGGILSDTDIVSDRGRFTQAVSEAVSGLFEPGKNGGMKAKDAQAVARKVGEFHKFSVESVDVEGLLRAILSGDPTLGRLNEFATDKHGNKLGLLARDFGQFEKDREELRKVPDNYGENISNIITGGLGGALERLTGAIETAYTNLGRANEGWLTPSIDKLGNTIEALAAAPPKVIEFASQVGLAAGALLGLRTAAMLATAASTGLSALGAGGGLAAVLGAIGKGGAAITGGAGAGALALGGLIYGAFKTGEHLSNAKNNNPDAIRLEQEAEKRRLQRKEADDKPLRELAAWRAQKAAAEGRGGAQGPNPATDVERLRPEKIDIGNRLDNLKAVVQDPVPVDVTGKVQSELKGQAQVNVTVKVDGGRVAGMSSSSSGNVTVNPGTALSEFPGAGY